MIPVAGRPFIEWPLMQLAAAGFTRVVLCIGYRGDVIRRHVGSGHQWGLDITYSEDSPRLDGTLGAVRRALPRLDDVVPVLYGDTYLTVDFAAVVRAHWAAGDDLTMTVLRNHGVGDTSNVVMHGSRVVAYGKNPPPAGAEWIDYGYSVFGRAVLGAFPSRDLADCMSAVAASGRAGGFVVHVPFREIGTPGGLKATDAHLRAHPPG